MRVPVLVFALVLALAALPVPAGQYGRGDASVSPPVPRVVPGSANLGVLLADPFAHGPLSFAAATSPLAAGASYGAL